MTTHPFYVEVHKVYRIDYESDDERRSYVRGEVECDDELHYMFTGSPVDAWWEVLPEADEWLYTRLDPKPFDLDRADRAVAVADVAPTSTSGSAPDRSGPVDAHTEEGP